MSDLREALTELEAVCYQERVPCDAELVVSNVARRTLDPVTTEELEAALSVFDEAEEWSRRPPVAMRAALEAFLKGRGPDR